MESISTLGVNQFTARIKTKTDVGRYSPWQNGRIERFFGTLKSYLKQIEIPSNEFNQRLQEFCFYYHHVRPHQNLNNQTPMEAWHQNKYCYQKKSWFSAWKGVLAGVIEHY